MCDASFDDADRRLLSELVDGEVDSHAVHQLCRAWRDDPGVRTRWHTYQLIGDVLRSEDLAHAPERDERFLAAVRERLASEPVVLAPLPAAPSAPTRLRRWRAPAAVAAGFVVVAGVVSVTRTSAPVAERAATMASAQVPAALVAASQPDAMADVQMLVADGKLIRDARLERYLAAHKQYGGSSAFTALGTVVRSSATGPER